jgi:hypothetical protein
MEPEAGEPGSAPTPPELVELEREVRLSESALWQLARTFYERARASTPVGTATFRTEAASSSTMRIATPDSVRQFCEASLKRSAALGDLRSPARPHGELAHGDPAPTGPRDAAISPRSAFSAAT